MGCALPPFPGGRSSQFAVRVPLVLGLSGVDLVEVVSGASEGDELIVSDMRDYLHLEQITLK